MAPVAGRLARTPRRSQPSSDALLLEGYSDIAGIMMPARHTVFARDDQDNVIADPLMVSIDVGQVEFEER